MCGPSAFGLEIVVTYTLGRKWHGDGRKETGSFAHATGEQAGCVFQYLNLGACGKRPRLVLMKIYS